MLSGGTGAAVEAIDAAAQKLGLGPEGQKRVQHVPTVTAKTAPDGATMRAVVWHGKKDMRVVDIPKPCVTDPGDVVLAVTNSCVCGSDLHLFLRGMPGLKSGDTLGHEFIGRVIEVGPDVKGVSMGDRVAVAFDIACGQCWFCAHGYHSSCDATNPSKTEEMMYGQTTSGVFGYSHLTGGYQGGQAEFVRVPLANTNCLRLPGDVSDADAVLLTDILPTAWHATEMGEVGPGDVAAIWGAGPVGILAAHCAQHRGARRVILIDNVADRLAHAQAKLPGVETVNFNNKDTLAALRDLTADEPAHAPDVCIDAVGFHYTKSWLHSVETTLQLETDSADVLNEMIVACRKGGRISIIGVYAGFTNHFNIGAFMEKQLTVRGGQTPVQRYWPTLLPKVRARELRPADVVVTHTLPLERAPEAYTLFNAKEDGVVKVILQPSGAQAAAEAPASPEVTAAA